VLARRKWPTGTYLLWYPIKGSGPAPFLRRLQRLAIPKVLRAELHVRAAAPGRFTGSGLIIVNPPWRLADELKAMLPALHTVLSQGRGSRTVLDAVNDKF
jgi:23S rRNA (adenine2030-N6)-methyltransferase